MRSVTGAERAVKAAALTPQMDALLQRIRRAARPPFHTLTPQGARAAYAAQQSSTAAGKRCSGASR